MSQLYLGKVALSAFGWYQKGLWEALMKTIAAQVQCLKAKKKKRFRFLCPTEAHFLSSQAHLKSEIIYNWEKNVYDGSDKPILRKKENKKATSFLSWIGFRDKKLEWVRKPQTPAFPCW